ncbi:MAG: peptidase C1A papain [Chitinophagaceae bacterium]|nr:peptidase C1A papain [Chitinophagaceae bacterium]
MPIRMTDDPHDPSQYREDEGGGASRPQIPGGGLLNLLPLLLSLFRGKGLIFLLILGAGAYFLLGRGGCQPADIERHFSQSGYSFEPKEFEKASIYEGLEEDNRKNPLPEAVSLLRFAPDRGDQGQQGSCVAWSCAYAAQTILTAAATGQTPNDIVFSPSYLYNQIRMEGCQGSYLQRAMEAMRVNGGVPLSQYPYDEYDCSRLPSEAMKQLGRQNLIHGFTRITNGDNLYEISVRGVKEHLAKNAPVVIGMMVGQSFMQDMYGKDVWQPSGFDQTQMGMGGHAMCVIGYDDSRYGGAFQIMNSWGPQWGRNGIAWVRYADFKKFVREAYGLHPFPKRSQVANLPLECKIGLIENTSKKNISLKVNPGSNIFRTVLPITPGTRFKMAIQNVTECYIYVFGKDTNETSYILFPYLKPGEKVSKHSPYCGITGYRLFPRAQSFEADAIGSTDYIAIVVSKEELDYQALNQAINRSTKSGYAEKVNDALSSLLIRSVKYQNTPDGNIYFKADANTNKAVACIVAIDKKR